MSLTKDNTMLVLRRREGQWIEITHSSGDVIRLRTYNIRPQQSGSMAGTLDIAFDDEARNFRIQRPERGLQQEKKAEELTVASQETEAVNDEDFAPEPAVRPYDPDRQVNGLLRYLESVERDHNRTSDSGLKSRLARRAG